MRMMDQALAKVRIWRRVIEHDAVEHGFKRPSGHQGQGHDQSMSMSATLAASRLGECQVYSGPRIPVNPTYLTVEVAIKQLPFTDDSEREAFRKWAFHNLKSMGTFNRKLTKAHLETARLLLSALSQPDVIGYN